MVEEVEWVKDVEDTSMFVYTGCVLGVRRNEARRGEESECGACVVKETKPVVKELVPFFFLSNSHTDCGRMCVCV